MPREHLLERFPPAGIGRGDVDDRPIAAESEPLRTEGLEHRVEIGLQRLDAPIEPGTLGEAGELAEDIGGARELADRAPPGLERAGRGERPSAMVEHDPELRDRLLKAEKLRQLPRCGEKVE